MCLPKMNLLGAPWGERCWRNLVVNESSGSTVGTSVPQSSLQRETALKWQFSEKLDFFLHPSSCISCISLLESPALSIPFGVGNHRALGYASQFRSLCPCLNFALQALSMSCLEKVCESMAHCSITNKSQTQVGCFL